MTRLKLKGAVAILAIGFAAFSTPAFAQVTTDDVDAQAYLERIHNNDIKFRDEKTEPHYKDQIKHYEAELKRLNALIDSYGYMKRTTSGGETNFAEEDQPHKEAFDALDISKAGRTAVAEATKGKSEEFGIQIDGFDDDGVLGTGLGASGAPAKFRKAIGLQTPKKLYPADNSTFAANLHRLYSSLYVANTVAGEANKSRDKRYEVYDVLFEQAEKSKDLQTELRIQNAILIENGRNLALLIDLQTAQLNSQTAEMTASAVAAQRSEEMFGGGSSLGSSASSELLQALAFASGG